MKPKLFVRWLWVAEHTGHSKPSRCLCCCWSERHLTTPLPKFFHLLKFKPRLRARMSLSIPNLGTFFRLSITYGSKRLCDYSQLRADSVSNIHIPCSPWITGQNIYFSSPRPSQWASAEPDSSEGKQHSLWRYRPHRSLVVILRRKFCYTGFCCDLSLQRTPLFLLLFLNPKLSNCTSSILSPSRPLMAPYKVPKLRNRYFLFIY